uniref:Uncharacterized protein n=1 Tax=Rhizophora mucronata TaxID=61149 RepID=A0A2P2LX35_RHIMU
MRMFQFLNNNNNKQKPHKNKNNPQPKSQYNSKSKNRNLKNLPHACSMPSSPEKLYKVDLAKNANPTRPHFKKPKIRKPLVNSSKRCHFF